jgi:anti-sigma-K factor RskA
MTPHATHRRRRIDDPDSPLLWRLAAAAALAVVALAAAGSLLA